MLQHHDPLRVGTTPDPARTSEEGCVAAVDIGGTNLRVAIADGQGQILARWSASTVGVREPELVIDLIHKGVLCALSATKYSLADLKAIGAGAPGITDTDRGVVIATSYLLGWRDIHFRDLLESAFNVPAAVDNDVNLGALGEHWMGSARGTESFVFLAIGTGLGAGIMLEGELFRGSRWTAGEVGYMLVPGTSTAPIEPGQPGALEGLVGGEGIRTQWRELWDQGGIPLSRDLSATEIFDHAVQGDLSAKIILEKTASMLAYAVYNIWLIFSCPLFVLGGAIGLHPALAASIRAQLQGLRPGVQPKLELSSLAADAQLFGAIRLALDLAHNPQTAARGKQTKLIETALG